MRTMKAGFAGSTLCAALAVLLLAACRDSQPEAPAPEAVVDEVQEHMPPPGWRIDAVRSVGGITPESTVDDLEPLFGSDQIEDWDIDVGEGMTEPGTRVRVAGSELYIEWHDNGTPRRISIQGDGEWRTTEGLGIGSTLAEVEQANGLPFMLTGFGWDYAGRTLSWEGGVLPTRMQFEFVGTAELSSEDRRAISGDGSFSSAHPAMQRYAPKVQRIFVRWD